MQKKEETKKPEVVETEEKVETVEVSEEATTEEKETKSHRAKRYLRVIVIFLVLFVGGSIIGNLLYNTLFFDKAQQDLLKEEIAEIGTLTNGDTYDYEALNKMLDETVTSDEYVPLEKALKDFTKDVIEVSATVDTAMDSEVVEIALSPANISADGPEFTTTLAELDATYATLETAKADFERLMTEETVLSYLPEDTDEEMVEIYKEIVSGIKMTPTDERYINLMESIDKRLAMIDAERAAINYLVEHKDDWTLESGYVYLSTEEQVNEYNALIEEFQKVVE